jgi:hypothetical protein
MEQIILRIAAIVGALGGIIGAGIKVKGWLKKRAAKKKEFETKVLESLAKINDDMHGVGDDVATIIRDRLETAHSHYMRVGWCPDREKGSLLKMYDSYTTKGYNSLIDSYAEDISSLQEFPPRGNTADACSIRPM